VYQATIVSGRQSIARFIQVQNGMTDTLSFDVQAPAAVASNNVPAPQPRASTPTPPPQSAGFGAVRMSVSPIHAEVVFGDRVLGTGRLERRLPAGIQTVTFRAPNCDPEERRVTVLRDDVVIVPPVSLTCR
jgi:hypothetical protein